MITKSNIQVDVDSFWSDASHELEVSDEPPGVGPLPVGPEPLPVGPEPLPVEGAEPLPVEGPELSPEESGLLSSPPLSLRDRFLDDGWLSIFDSDSPRLRVLLDDFKTAN